jgi:hypothetical protein
MKNPFKNFNVTQRSKFRPFNVAPGDTLEIARLKRIEAALVEIANLPQIIQPHDETEFSDEDRAADAQRENIKDIARAALEEKL